MSLLEVTDLRVSFPTADGVVQAVRGVSFEVDSGQTLGIVGESGSGKTVCTQTLIGLSRGADISGRAAFDGTDLLALDEEEMRRYRGAQIATIFQDPLTSLHPLYKVGWQIAEMIRAHDRTVSKAQARQRAIELLAQVGIPQASRRVDDYPHQFSGGMRQRVMIAMALALNPRLIIADEPTTALDATVQAQILDLMLRLQREYGTALILITHDLGVIADTADDVLVMYAGKAVERADRRTLFYRPHHPYTKGLLESIPGSSGSAGAESAGRESQRRLQPIPGQPPSLINVPPGCAFHPRCGYAMDRCRTDIPPLMTVPAGTRDGEAGPHSSACWLPLDAAGLGPGAERLRQQFASAHRTAPVGTAGAADTAGVTSSMTDGNAG